MTFEPRRYRKNRSARMHDARTLCALGVSVALLALPSCSSDSGAASVYAEPPPPATRVLSDSNTVNWTSDDASATATEVVPVFHERIFIPDEGVMLTAAHASELERVLAAANDSPDARVELVPRVSDPSDPSDANRGLSRAIEVSAYLMDGGVTRSRIAELPAESNAPIITGPERPEGYAEHVEVVMFAEPPKPTQVNYYWNAWVDPLDSSSSSAKPSYEPAEYLEPGESYLLNVHLSGLEYKYLGVKRFAVAQRLSEKLDEEVADPATHEVSFKVVLLTDERAFNTPSRVIGDLTVSIDKIRSYLAAGRPGSSDPMRKLAKGRDVDFLFGRMPEVTLQTSGAMGPTAVGLSFWLDGRPFAEISIPFCVRKKRDAPCPQDELATTSFGGSGILDAAGEASGDKGPPDAALHVVELYEGKLIGIFHRGAGAGASGVESHFVWPIKESAQAFVKQLGQLQDQFGQITTAPIPIGKDFKNLLFAGTGTQVQQAKAAFDAFFAANRGATPFEKEKPATIFVRMILQDLPRPWLYPLGLMNVDGTEDGFLGYHVRVETPLPRQSYAQAPSCIGNWVPVLPIAVPDPPLQEALVEVSRSNRIEADMLGEVTGYRVVTGRTPVTPLKDMLALHTWLGEEAPASGSSILSVISHHDDETLYFAKNQTHINPSSIQRPMAGSVAVLSGCSTGVLGSAGIVRALNEHGVESVITTNTGVSGRLAGDFVECLSSAVESEALGSEIPVGAAFSKALRCLYNESATSGPDAPSLHAHLVLSFTLAGNPNIELCGPE